MEKNCPRCGLSKSVAEFSRDKSARDGYCTYCKACKRSWAADTREDRTAAQRKWRRENMSRHVENVNRDRRKHAERARISARIHTSRRRAVAARVTTLAFSKEDLLQRWAYYGNKCWICRDADAGATDHVKPLSKGGANMLCNFRPICKPCNSAKGNTWPYEVAVNKLTA